MFKKHKILISCLMLAALFASGAHAVSIDVNPGPVGGPANQLSWTLPNPPAPDQFAFDIMFTDNKTLEWGAGTQIFSLLTSAPAGNYFGAFLDAGGDSIPGTAFVGRFPDTVNPIPLAVVNLADPTVFSGMTFISVTSQNGPGFPAGSAFQLDWVSSTPTVGEVPVPAAAWLFGSGLLGLIGIARRKKTA